MYKERPEITDEASAQQVLGISLLEYARAITRFEREACEAVLKKHEQEWAPWIAEAKVSARKVMVSRKRRNFDRYMKELKEFIASKYWRRRRGLRSALSKAAVQWELTTPKDVATATEQVWKKQWKDELSDYWRKSYYGRLVNAVIHRRFDGDDEKVAAARPLAALPQSGNKTGETYASPAHSA